MSRIPLLSYGRLTLEGLVYLVIGLTMITEARIYLLQHGIHGVTPPDFFLDLIPAAGMEGVLIWGVPLLLAVIVAALALHLERIPMVLSFIGLLFLLRSFFVILTPMGLRPDQFITDPQGFFQNLAYGTNDFFFSGHVSFPLMLALLFWDLLPFRIAFLSFASVFAVAVMVAHTHYSIDVFAVPFIVPSIYRLGVVLFPEHVAYAEQSRSHVRSHLSFPLIS